jgi:subtilisin family serine protease
MRRSRLVAFTGAVALATTAFGASTATAALQSPTTSSASTASSTAGSGTYVVLVDSGADARAVAAALRKKGATVTSVNTDIGLISVRSTSAKFLSTARGLSGVKGAAKDGVVGRAPDAAPVADKALKEHQASPNRSSRSGHGTKKAPKADPLDSLLWGMDMINAPEAHAITLGNKKVKVGVMDTGVDGNHPDLAPNFDRRLSRNFVTDMSDIDGDVCEHPSCVDPVDEDDNGHGTHTAGTMAAALNGIGVSGVAPNVSLVNVRAGQDSGYFFLSATADALTYSGNAGLDVVNMSFYVDPWLYNCKGGAPEDSPAEAAEQDVIIETMNRALSFAHRKGVTLVAALGNEHDDVSHPRADVSSPDYGAPTHPRTIDNANCLNLPLEGPHVIGVSSLGPSERKSDFSNYASDLRSGELEVSAPGGWFRDGFGTPTYRTNENEILSTAPLNVLQSEGQVDAAGNITPAGVALGTMKDCGTVKGKAVCGYYQYLQGTSMASPHAAGVAALAVSAHGHAQGKGGFGLDPDRVRRLLLRTATDHACPTPPLQTYTAEGRSTEFNALCTGTPDRNSFYGEGIVNALGVVAGRHHGGHH